MEVIEEKTFESAKFDTQLGYLANADGSAQLSLGRKCGHVSILRFDERSINRISDF